MTDRICWINGDYVAESHAHVSIFDRGLLFGDGVYEVAAALNGRLLDADLHLVRLERSMREIGLVLDRPAAELAEVMQALLDRNGVQSGLVYLQVTRGPAERDFPFPANPAPTVFAYARPKRYIDDPNATGIALHAVPDIRWARRDIKSTAMLAQVLAKQAARAAGAYEAVMHQDGEVTEGGSSNVWIVRDGAAITRVPSHAILAGITRDVTRLVAAEIGVPVVDRPFTLDELRGADEAFITSATSFVLPVVSLDGVPVGGGVPGPVTGRLREAYIARAERLTRPVGTPR